MAKPIGIQLYTVRDLCKDDFPGTLRAIADIGFKGVEFAGLHGMSPKEVATLLDELGMVAASAHIQLPADDEGLKQIVDEYAQLGVTRVVSGAGPNDMTTLDACKQVAERFQHAAEAFAGHDMELGYHNHWWEFDSVDGQWAYDRLMTEAPSLVAELDIYWAADAGADPVDVLSKYRDRTPLLHVKDGLLEKDAPHVAVGKGRMDIPGVLAAANPDVTAWHLIELDHCATDMLEAVRDSYGYLTSSGLSEGNK
jgi:sugar phosphate isomerase/epimerase